MRVLHIGQRKTGTSWLQAGAKVAADAGVLRYSHRSLIDTSEERTRARKMATSEYCTIADALPTETDLPVFASLETLITLDQPTLAAEVARVWPDAQILVTTRGPQGYMQSSFNNLALNGGTTSPMVFARRFRRHMMLSHNLDQVVAAWTAALGPGRITFVPFELLRTTPDTFVDSVEALIGTSLRPYLSAHARHPSPPPAHLALLRELNAELAQEAPGFASSKVWNRFVKATTLAVALAHKAGLLAGQSDESPRKPSPLPELPDGTLDALAAQMTVLRNMPLYQPFLPLYGLTPATATAMD